MLSEESLGRKGSQDIFEFPAVMTDNFFPPIRRKFGATAYKHYLRTTRNIQNSLLATACVPGEGTWGTPTS